jgi:hypothetical protein
MYAAPAGSGAATEYFIQAGSDSNDGIGARVRAVPEIVRVAPLIFVWPIGECGTNSIG